MRIFDVKNLVFSPFKEGENLKENCVLINTQEEIDAISASITGGGAVWLENGTLKYSGKAPSDFHRWNGKKWVLDKTAQAEKTQEKTTALIDHIDDVAAQIYARWNRFKTEYEEREKAALAFKETNFTGEPSFFITSFSQSAGLDNRSAAELILRQAQGLRHLLEQLAALRMRKYELKNPGLNLEQLQQLHDDIVQAMNQLAEAV